jgi:hypothetical protein
MAKRRIRPDVLDAIRRLGREGGKARARTLTQAERRAIAKKAAAARWKKDARQTRRKP